MEDRKHDGTAAAMHCRIMELETEKVRLQSLVADLLMKNQQLRADRSTVRQTAGPGAVRVWPSTMD